MAISENQSSEKYQAKVRSALPSSRVQSINCRCGRRNSSTTTFSRIFDVVAFSGRWRYQKIGAVNGCMWRLGCFHKHPEYNWSAGGDSKRSLRDGRSALQLLNNASFLIIFAITVDGDLRLTEAGNGIKQRCVVLYYWIKYNRSTGSTTKRAILPSYFGWQNTAKTPFSVIFECFSGRRRYQKIGAVNVFMWMVFCFNNSA